MNLWLRLIRVLLLGLFRPRLNLVDESCLNFSVWPTDLDFNVHMTNSRYFSLMDLGRVELIMRSGLARLAMRRHLQPVVGSAIVRFRRPLPPFARFTLRSRIIAWDGKWVFFEQRIERKGELACRTVVKGAFLEKGVPVPLPQLVESLGHREPSPVLPRWVSAWQEAEAAQHQPIIEPVKEQQCAL